MATTCVHDSFLVLVLAYPFIISLPLNSERGMNIMTCHFSLRMCVPSSSACSFDFSIAIDAVSCAIVCQFGGLMCLDRQMPSTRFEHTCSVCCVCIEGTEPKRWVRKTDAECSCIWVQTI